MKIINVVHGSSAQAIPLVIAEDMVYVHTDIRPNAEVDPVTGEPRNDFVYREVQYTKEEYLKLMADQAIEVENALCDLDAAAEARAAAYEDALCDMDTVLCGGGETA